ncbi:MAG: hypothetical protein M0P43_04730 [Arcobacteraceae bacterium]|nr:hypothetical protein [Arcobacteraceae bacterium]
MPQLIAMIIVVVGAMIYMFQTFGGTGDKIEGIAQKTSIITEINNIKNGVKLAARSEHIEAVAKANTDAVTNLTGLAAMNYFAQQINEQLTSVAPAAIANEYNAISFGGVAGTNNAATAIGDRAAMRISLVTINANRVPGIYVEFGGLLADSAGFLETQIATDLASIARIDRHATAVPTTASADTWGGATTGTDARIPAATGAGTNTANDGRFIIYFNDFAANEVVLP